MVKVERTADKACFANHGSGLKSRVLYMELFSSPSQCIDYALKLGDTTGGEETNPLRPLTLPTHLLSRSDTVITITLTTYATSRV